MRPRCQPFFDDFFFVVFLLVFFAVFLLDVFDAFLADFIEDFFAADRALFFGGTFLPSRRASDRPMAMACLRLLTLRLEAPLFNVPALRFFIARSTSRDAPLEYLRAVRAMMMVSL